MPDPTDTRDLLDNVRAGDADPTPYPRDEANLCNQILILLDSDPWFCTRQKHSEEWNHIAGDGNKVHVVWRTSVLSYEED